jgi:hypothetical protein
MSDLIPLRIFSWGILHAIGMFSIDDLAGEERIDCGNERAWFGFGEVLMAGLMAATLAVPAGVWFAGRTDLPLAFIAAGILFLPLFVFLPRLVRYAMKADTDAVLEAFGKNEKVRKVFWAIFLATAGLVLAQVLDPAAAEKVLSAMMGI